MDDLKRETSPSSSRTLATYFIILKAVPSVLLCSEAIARLLGLQERKQVSRSDCLLRFSQRSKLRPGRTTRIDVINIVATMVVCSAKCVRDSDSLSVFYWC